MGILQTPTGPIFLSGRHLLGRSRTMQTVIDNVQVSGQHAVIRWSGDRWIVRDLGSRNGTTLGGHPLPAGQDVPLLVGVDLRLGGTQPIQLTSDAAPAPSAKCGGEWLEGDAEMLALPSTEMPKAIIAWIDPDGWHELRGEQTVPVKDGHTITVQGKEWVLHLPEALSGTQGSTAERTVAHIRLAFKVSADEEYVECTVHEGVKSTALKPRAHHYLLLTLARQRLQDRASGIAESEAGWVATEQLEKMLRASSNQIYVTIHRIRKEFHQFSLLDASEIVQRRPTTRQVRIGVTTMSVASLDG
ncbi:MAG: FHA domain-containing protein [Myxococcota bacterium]